MWQVERWQVLATLYLVFCVTGPRARVVVRDMEIWRLNEAWAGYARGTTAGADVPLDTVASKSI